MFLKELKIENFRNISKQNLVFNKNINIFIGNNAQGKTNIIESIYFLAITKSHRTNNELNLIKQNELYTKIVGKYANDNINSELSILLNEKGKKVTINNVPQKKISNYLSIFNVILFCPDDLEIIKGSPSIRRKYLNIELSQLENKYLIILKEYNQILKQRNEYLKQKSNAQFDKKYFDVITENLIDKNIQLIKYRYDFINEINKYLSNIFYKISGKKNLSIKYKSFILEEEINQPNIKEILIKKYNLNFTNELLQKTTLLGCHRDDFKIYLNNFDVTEFCSQGQQRMCILCLKLSEIEVFINKKQTNPIILLDDIFSELDDDKKNNIIKYFNKNIQIFITTTDIKNINDELKSDSDIFLVNNGNVTREE